jgi:predicted transcriptional regulator YdeE
MEKIFTELPEIKMAGLSFLTSYAIESVRESSRISPFVQNYFYQKISERIISSKEPGTTYCVYTNYKNDYRGAYTFFIGEEVDSLNKLSPDLKSLIIPAQKYVKFTTKSGMMPDVVIKSWQKIWEMTPDELGGERSYLADFEVYNKRACNPQQAILDIYVGINS